MKVWQSYLENKTSGAMRMYWVYGPDQKDITIIGLEPHSEDKKMVHTGAPVCETPNGEIVLEEGEYELINSVEEKNAEEATEFHCQICRIKLNMEF